MIEFAIAAPLLQAAGISEAADERLDLAALAAEHDMSRAAMQYHWDELDGYGLVLSPPDADLPPRLLHSGRQYLAADGNVSAAVLRFLPRTIDDLVARRALLAAGTILVDEFRAQLLGGHGVEHARELVPAAFSDVITEAIALDLYAAAVALLARLSDEQPAGCVAEEIIAVELIQQATAWIELEQNTGEIDPDEAISATHELRGLFELFQDDDVLNLFDMREPADAAVEGHSVINISLGVVDQRVEAWFEPFQWTSPTGYLSDSRPEMK